MTKKRLGTTEIKLVIKTKKFDDVDRTWAIFFVKALEMVVETTVTVVYHYNSMIFTSTKNLQTVLRFDQETQSYLKRESPKFS